MGLGLGLGLGLGVGLGFELGIGFGFGLGVGFGFGLASSPATVKAWSSSSEIVASRSALSVLPSGPGARANTWRGLGVGLELGLG